MKKLVLFALGFFMACAAHASFAPTSQLVYFSRSGVTGNEFTTEFPSAAAACQNSNNAQYGQTFALTPPLDCVMTAGGNYSYTVRVLDKGLACPANSTNTSGSCSCNTGYSESGSSCVPKVNACAPRAGVAGITNFTVGYSRTGESNDFNVVGTPNRLPTSGQMCDSGCTVNLGEATTAWQSQVPTDQGLYRWSIDLVSTPSGAECTAGVGDAPVDKTLPNPLCPGYVGEINGKKGCYGTANNPVNVVQGDRPASGSKPPGNPAAGAKPPSGEGSGSDGAGRTPAAGSGGSGGGPASSAVGPRSTVATPASGEEQANCGAPGQAKCRIDESGTPDGKDVWTKATTEVVDARASQKTAIDGAANIGSPNWSFTFSLPTGCTPVPVYLNVVLDVCKYQPVIHDLMSMIWAAATLFCITGMVGRAIREA